MTSSVTLYGLPGKYEASPGDANEAKKFLLDVLLEHVCRWTNIVFIANYELNLELVKQKGNRFIGICPYCQTKSLTLNKKTGYVSCRKCGKEDNFLTLFQMMFDYDLAAALHLLKEFCEIGKEQRKKEAAEKRRFKKPNLTREQLIAKGKALAEAHEKAREQEEREEEVAA